MDVIEPFARMENSKSFLNVAIDTLRALCHSQHVSYYDVSSEDDGYMQVSSSLSRDKPLLRKEDFVDQDWDRMCRMYSHGRRSGAECAAMIVLPIWRDERLAGFLLAEDESKDDEETVKHRLLAFVSLIVEALQQDERDQQQKLYQSFHAQLIKLARFAEGDLPREELDRMQGSDPPIGSSSIFGLGANMIRDLFQKRAHTCMIFDATSIRYVPGDETSPSVSDATTSNDADDRQAQGSAGSERDSSARSRLLRGESGTFTGQTMDYITSTKGMGGETLQSYLATNNISLSSNGFQAVVEDGERLVEGDDRMTEVKIVDDLETKTASNTEHSQADEVLGATSGKVLCSYARAPFPVPLLAFSGDGRVDADAMASLEGDKVRRTMAGYFASARQSDHGAQVFLEWGKKEQSDLRVRQLLGRDENKGGIICAASVDASLQPSFWMLILFEDQPVYTRTETLLVEQVGIILSHSLLRKRARAVDFAQQLFMQKVQHELRTPLHAIIGVNETLSYAVKTAQSDHSDGQFTRRRTDKKAPRRSKDEDIKQVLIELSDLNASIAGSADQLSALVDDLVDFSLLQQGPNRRRPFTLGASGASMRSHIDKEDAMPGHSESAFDPVGAPCAVTIATLLSVLSTTVGRCWSLFRRPGAVDEESGASQPPPPELVMLMEGMSAFDQTQARLLVDLDCLRRVVWKLVSNAIQYTNEGLIKVTVTLKSIEIKPDVGLQVSQPSKSTAKKAYRLQLCIADSGIGMSNEFLSGRVFQAYQQEDQDSVGLGLSLTLCRYLVDQMGGWIKADSQEGQGSTFTFSIPAQMTNKSKLEGSTSDKANPSTTSYESPVVRLAFLGFKEHKSLAMLQDAVTSNLNGAQVESLAVHEDTLKIDHAINVVVIAVEYWEDEEKKANIIASAFDSFNEMPLLILSHARNTQQKHSVTLRDRMEQVYKDRGASELVYKLKRPFLIKQLDQLQQVCEEARLRRAIKSDNEKSVERLPDEQAARPTIPPQDNVEASSVSSSASHSHTDSTSASAVNRSLSHASTDDDGKTFKVLVVEDNPLNAKILTAHLTRARIPFLTAADGVEGVEIFKKELPAVVLLDINMPRMNGFEAAKVMRAVNSPFRHYIVAITALSAERDRVQGLDAGIDAWLTKPARLGPLIADLQERKRILEAQAAEA